MIYSFNFETVLVASLILVVIGLVIGLLIALANKFLQVKEDDRIEVVSNVLPGYNCGACGTAGCHAFAEKLVNKEESKVSTCKVIKPDKKEEIISYLGSTPGPDGNTITVE